MFISSAPQTQSPSRSAPAKPQTLPKDAVPWAITLLCIALGIFLRIDGIGTQSLWFDEGYTAWMVSHSPAEIIRLIRADTAPPLYYLLLHGWCHLFGRSESALRSLSCLFSILTLLLGFSIARRMLKSAWAIAAVVAVMSISYLPIEFAQEARAYALMGFLGAAAFDCLQRHLAAPHRRWLIALALLIAAAIYTHNMMAPYVIALLCAGMILPGQNSPAPRMFDLFIAAMAAMALYLPWALFGLPAQMQMIRHSFWMDPLARWDLPATTSALAGVKYFWSWSNLLQRAHLPVADGAVPMTLAAALLLTSATISLCQPPRRRRESIALLCAGFLPLLLVAFCSIIWTPVFTAKIFLPSATLLPIFFALPLDMKWNTRATRVVWSGAAVWIALAALTLYGYGRENLKEDWRGINRTVSQWPPARRLFVFDANDGRLPFDYYHRYQSGEESTGVPGDFFDLNPPRTMRRIASPSDLDALRRRINPAADATYQQIMLVLAHDSWADPHGDARRLILKGGWRPSGQATIRDLTVEWFQKPDRDH